MKREERCEGKLRETEEEKRNGESGGETGREVTENSLKNTSPARFTRGRPYIHNLHTADGPDRERWTPGYPIAPSLNDPRYMNRKVRKFRTDQFDT